jgi:hypothetical protein
MCGLKVFANVLLEAASVSLVLPCLVMTDDLCDAAIVK